MSKYFVERTSSMACEYLRISQFQHNSWDRLFAFRSLLDLNANCQSTRDRIRAASCNLDKPNLGFNG